jgi:hypothetical protein
MGDAVTRWSLSTPTVVAALNAAGPGKDARGSRLASEAADFLRSQAGVLLLALIAMVLAHGLAVSSPSLSVDEELFATSDVAGGFREQGRPAITLFKIALGRTLPLPFLGPALSLAILYAVGVTWAFLFTRASGRRPSRVGLLLFMLVFTTLPVHAYYLMWNVVAVEFSIGLLLASVSAWLAWLWGVEGWGKAAAVAAVLLATIAGLTYQSLTFVTLVGVLIGQLVRIVAGDTVASPSRGLRVSLRLVMPGVAALVASAVISIALIPPGSYWASFLRWGTAPLDIIVTDLARGILAYVEGNGFVGGWVLLPTLGAWLFAFCLLAIRAIRGGGWYGPVLLLAVVILPFANSLGVGTMLPNRALQALPLVAASAWFIVAMQVNPRRQVAPVLVAIGFALWVWQAGVTTRLYHVEIATHEVDRSVAAAVTERLARVGWDGREIPLVSVGTRPPSAVEELANHESFGLSFFNELDNGRRAPAYLIALGHAVRYPTRAERTMGVEYSAVMPVWPANGSVVLTDGIAIVKFSDPPMSGFPEDS